MALQNGVIAFFIQNPFYLVQISHFTSTKAAPDHHITSTMTGGVRHSSSIFSLVLRLTNVFLCDLNTSNLDLSVHNTFFQSSSVQCLCSFAHPTLFLLLPSLGYGFFFATLPRKPASRSHLFTVDVETGILRVPFNDLLSALCSGPALGSGPTMVE